ncbi:MAG: DUF4358 domain-containing protein [Ruminococcus sp.]|jgi:hypothetical protein|nr:DUF4358 domain-containing protein [Ruminococcus sp.]
MSKIKIVGVIFAVILCLTACGAKEETVVEPAPADVTAAVMSVVELSSPSEKTLENIGAYYTDLDTSSVAEMSVYVCGSGAYPDEIAVIKFKDAAKAESGFEAVSARYDAMVKTFIDYTPDEMYKLDSAVLEKKGNYVIFIASADNAKALAIADELFQ